MENCLNCGEKLVGKYCHNCGQKAKVKRYSFKTFFEDVYSTVFEFDSSFFRTFGYLAVKPGEFIRVYLLGKRKNFLSPFRYLFIVFALNIAATWIIHKPAIEPVKTNVWGSGPVADQIINLEINLVLLIIIIPFAAGMKIVNKKFNSLENYVFIVYIHSQSILFIIILQLIIYFSNIVLPYYAEGIMWLGLFTVLYAWGFITFFEGAVKSRVFKFVISYLFGTLLIVTPIIVFNLLFKGKV